MKIWATLAVASFILALVSVLLLIVTLSHVISVEYKTSAIETTLQEWGLDEKDISQ